MSWLSAARVLRCAVCQCVGVCVSVRVKCRAALACARLGSLYSRAPLARRLRLRAPLRSTHALCATQERSEGRVDARGGFVDYRELRPIAPDAVVKKGTPMCRGQFMFLQYLPKEGEYTITFKAKTVGNRKLNCSVQMRGGDGNGSWSVQHHRPALHFSNTALGRYGIMRLFLLSVSCICCVWERFH